MKNTDIQNALSNVDDKYIYEAASYKSPARSLKIWRAIAIAACCAIAVPLTVLAAFAISDAAGSSDKASGSVPYYSEGAAETYAETAPANIWAAGGAMEEIAAEDYADQGEYVNAIDSESGQSSSISQAPGTDEKIIRTADVTIQSTEYDDAINTIDSLTKEAGGYYESKNISDGSGYRSAYFTVRIPADKYDDFVKGLKQAGTMTGLYENAEDVSDSYTDIESRLETARTKLARLNELLSRAEDMSDIITIEDAISETEWEIDYYEGSLAGYDSRINYSTVYISLSEVYKVEHENTPITFAERLSSAFEHGLDSFGDFLGDVAIWFAESWIWLIITGLLIAGAIVIPIACVKSARRRRNK